MIRIRKANQRGHADHGWLKSHHTFSFARYRDPAHAGFRSLRVMNEDRVEPGNGFGTHAHDNMEIISYVLSGVLEHKDSMGNGEVLRPGEFQRISAGSGITHSEFNPSAVEPVHFYQIWLVPNQRGIEPSYLQREFDESEKQNRFRLVASPDGDEGSLTIHADAKVYLSRLSPRTNSVSTLQTVDTVGCRFFPGQLHSTVTHLDQVMVRRYLRKTPCQSWPRKTQKSCCSIWLDTKNFLRTIRLFDFCPITLKRKLIQNAVFG